MNPRNNSATARVAELLERIEDLEDALLIAQRRHEPTIPAEVAHRLAAGEPPLRVWREYRGMTIRDLATKAAISPSMLSEMETGKREGRLSVLRRVTQALAISLDDAIPAGA